MHAQLLSFLFTIVNKCIHIRLNFGKIIAVICVDVCPKKLIRVSEETNSLGQFTVGFLDPKGECIGCAVCAMRCPHLAITEVVKEK